MCKLLNDDFLSLSKWPITIILIELHIDDLHIDDTDDTDDIDTKLA